MKHGRMHELWCLVPAAVLILAVMASAQQARAGADEIYPDSTRTPGAANPDITQDNIQDNICNKKWTTDKVRPPVSVTSPIKTQTMHDYECTDSATHYELDHLISLQNGGCPACVENLWPEAYGDTQHHKTQKQRSAWDKAHPTSKAVLPGALQKDRVEGYVHDAICLDIPNAKFTYSKKNRPPHGVTLARGQEILATDWYMCYVKMSLHMACQ